MKGLKKKNNFKKKKFNYPKKITKRTYNEAKNEWKNREHAAYNYPKFKINSDNACLLNQKIILDKDSILLKIFNLKEKYLELENNITYSINVPNNYELENYKDISKTNYYLYYYINKHLDLPKNDILEIDINMDGNHYFNNISLFFTKSQKYNLLFRYVLYKYCKDYYNELQKKIPLLIITDKIMKLEII